MLRGLYRLVWKDEGGFALVMTMAYLVMAVPLTIAALQMASQLALNASLHQDRLVAMYSSGGALEAALREIRLRPDNPNDLSLDLNGGTTNVYIDRLATNSSDLSSYAYADFVMTLDVSGSISNAELLDLEEAANSIVDAFDLDFAGERIRIGLTKFASDSTDMVDMTDFDAVIGSPTADHWAGVPLHDAINNLDDIRVCTQWIFSFCIGWGDPDVGSTTNIVAALDTAAAHFASGLGDRAEIPNLMVVITDGDDSVGNSDTDIANSSAATGAEVFAVGVGAGVNMTTLNAIASEPDADHVFTANDFQDLLNIIDTIVQAVNDASEAGTAYDIQIAAAGGNMTYCRVLRTVNEELVVLSCV